MEERIDIQEIKDLLEKAKSVYAGYGSSERYAKLLLYLDQIPTLLKQQPTAGDWTKKWRGNLSFWGSDKDNQIVKMWKDGLLEACDRLDTAEAINKDLLELCEEFMEKADDGSASFDDPEPGSIFLRAEAIIGKAKKEG